MSGPAPAAVGRRPTAGPAAPPAARRHRAPRSAGTSSHRPPGRAPRLGARRGNLGRPADGAHDTDGPFGGIRRTHPAGHAACSAPRPYSRSGTAGARPVAREPEEPPCPPRPAVARAPRRRVLARGRPAAHGHLPAAPPRVRLRRLRRALAGARPASRSLLLRPAADDRAAARRRPGPRDVPGRGGRAGDRERRSTWCSGCAPRCSASSRTACCCASTRTWARPAGSSRAGSRTCRPASRCSPTSPATAGPTRPTSGRTRPAPRPCSSGSASATASSSRTPTTSWPTPGASPASRPGRPGGRGPPRPARPDHLHHRRPQLARPRRRAVGLPGRRRRRHPGLRPHRRRLDPRPARHARRRGRPHRGDQRVPAGLDQPDAAAAAQRGRPVAGARRRPRRPHRRDAGRRRRRGHRGGRVRDHASAPTCGCRTRRPPPSWRAARREDVPAPVVDALRWLRTVGARLGVQRLRRGGIEARRVEPELAVAVVEGVAEQVAATPSNPANLLIERLMVAANESVGRVAGRPRAAGRVPRAPLARPRRGRRARGLLRRRGLPPRLRPGPHAARPVGAVVAARRRGRRDRRRGVGRAAGLPRPGVVHAAGRRALRAGVRGLPALHQPAAPLRRPRRPPRRARLPRGRPRPGGLPRGRRPVRAVRATSTSPRAPPPSPSGRCARRCGS